MRFSNSSDRRLTFSPRSHGSGLNQYDGSDAAASSSAVPVDRQMDYRAAIRRRRWILLLLTLLGLGAGYLFSRSQPPVYQARTTLEIRTLNDNFLNSKEVNPSGTLTE